MEIINMQYLLTRRLVEIREDDENFAVQWVLCHYIVLLRFLMSVKHLIWPSLHDFFTWVEQ